MAYTHIYWPGPGLVKDPTYFGNTVGFFSGANISIDSNIVTSGSFTSSGAVKTSGNMSIDGTLKVGGIATLNSAVKALANMSLNGTFDVGGLATFNQSIIALSNLSLDGTLSVDGIATFNNTIVSASNISLNGALSVDGASTVAALTASGTLKATGAVNLSHTGNLKINPNNQSGALVCGILYTINGTPFYFWVDGSGPRGSWAAPTGSDNGTLFSGWT